MRQEVARAHKGWALDSVIIHNEVLKLMKEEIRGAPNVIIITKRYYNYTVPNRNLFLQEGVYVYGLFLDGAGWDKRNAKVIESAPKVLNVLMPIIHIYAINTNEMKRDPKIGLYQV